MRRIGSATAIVAALAAVASIEVTHAANITVNDPQDLVLAGDGRCTLREAVINANLAAGGDLTAGDCVAGDPGFDLVELPPGNYVMALAGIGEEFAAVGDYDVLDHMALVGASADLTVIDADGLDRVIDVAPGGQQIEVEILQLTLTGGFLAGPSDGGGVRISLDARVAMQEVAVSGSRAENGGGIHNEGELFIAGSSLRGNAAEFGGDGGALYNLGQAEITSTHLGSNQADRHGGGILNRGILQMDGGGFDFDSAGGNGGAIHNSGRAEIFRTDVGVCQSVLDGGAFYHDGTYMLIEQCRFLNNHAQSDGGTIYSAADIEILRSEIQGSIAFVDGGAMAHTGGQASISGTLVSSNQSAGRGAGIFNTAAVEITRSQINTNFSDLEGGGLYNSGSAIVTLSTMEFNSTNSSGGAIFNADAAGIRQSLLATNFARNGGGSYTQGGALTEVINSTLSGNQSFEDGAAFFVEGTVHVDFATVARNEANGLGGGFFNVGDVRLKNSIVSGNSVDCEGASPVSAGYNLDSDGTCDLFSVGDIPATNPNLGALQFNGGPTRTHALLLPSPAIDSADPGCLNLGGVAITEDQRQMPRPLDGDGNTIPVCDRGAYESALPSGPQPPVPNGVFGHPLRVGKSGGDLDLFWDVSLCPSTGYHLVYGDLDDVSVYAVGGGECSLSVTGTHVWHGSPARDLWFLVIADDAVQTEGSWGAATSGERNGTAPSGVCSMIARDNTGTCP